MNAIKQIFGPVFLRASAVIAGLVMLCSPAGASVIDFDDIAGVPGESSPHVPLGFIPAGYNGFNWDGGFNVMKQETFHSSRYNNTALFPSFDQAVTNNGSEVVSISSATPFDFLGGSFIAWGRDDQKADIASTSIGFRFYRGSTLVGDVVFDIMTDQFRTISFSDDWIRGIHRVELISSTEGITDPNVMPTLWIMDDLVFDREPGTNNPVPEPSTAVLFIAGIAGLCGITRRQARGRN